MDQRLGIRPTLSIKSIKPNVAEVALPDMPDEHPLAGIVGRWLGKFTGTGDIAAADVKPITGEPPFWNCVHAVARNNPMPSG